MDEAEFQWIKDDLYRAECRIDDLETEMRFLNERLLALGIIDKPIEL